MYRLTDEIALVQTIDFFPPLVDDPFVYGQIAAANALSDVYAMGGVPKTALNLVGFPDDKVKGLDWLERILQGGAERCKLAGVAVVGGHTVRDAEIKFGMAVTGIIHPKKILTNANAKPGDRLVLTKPLGTGFVTTAGKANSCPPDLFEAACRSMIELNAAACAAAVDTGVNAVTDVTGFGLAGHAFEMADGSGVTFIVNLKALPLLPGVEKIARRPFLTRASHTNREYVADAIRIEGKSDAARLECFFDAQTSGGLLISVPAEKLDLLLARLKERGTLAAAVIGEVVAREQKTLVVRD